MFGTPLAAADPGSEVSERCTNQIDYAGDPRSNAEINGIGYTTGVCPTPITAGSAYVTADTPAAFGERNYQVICNYVGQEPSPHGIWAANSILLSQQQDLNYGQMQAAIGVAISNHCSQYASIYSAYRSRYP
jgi:hypothetical protein